jgi:hypothetical protein
MKNKKNEFGILSLVFGIIGIFLFWIPILGLISPILSIIFYNKSKKTGDKNKMAVFGLVLGIIVFVFSFFVYVFYTVSMLAFIIVLTEEPKIEIDKETYEELGFNYSKDKNNVYHFNEKVEGADPETFILPQ